VVVEGLVKKFRRIPRRTLKGAILDRWMRPGGQGSGEYRAVDDLSFRVAPGECLGVIGQNGCGKSTLLKVLCGILLPDQGSVRVEGRIAPLIELEAGFHPDLTGRENVFLNASILGFPRRETQRRLGEILDFAGMGEFIDTPVKFYSSGMKARLGFSVAVHVDAEILLVDEVLEVGDAIFQPMCYRKIADLKGAGSSIIFVSHSLGSVAKICDRTLWIAGGKSRRLGPTAEVVAAYQQAMTEAGAAGSRA
jgi:ABC-type polysaccharide/polyol phosphate transport system ATPase subunit